MSLRAPRCGQHPFHALVGVCAFCVRERLAGLAGLECASDAAALHTCSRKKKENPSSGRALATQGLSSKPPGDRGIDQPGSVNTCVLSDASNVCSEVIAGKGKCNPLASIAKSQLHAMATAGSDRPFSVGAVTHVQRNVDATSTKATVESRSSLKCSSRPNKHGGPDVVNGRDGDEFTRSMEVAAGRPSFSSAKSPSVAPVESSNPPLVDIKMPILENSQQIFMAAKAIKKHASVDNVSPLSAASGQQVHCAAFSDGERSNFDAGLGVGGSRALTEPRIKTDVSRKDAEIVLSDASRNPSHTKKTLSSLFSLDNAELSATKKKKTEELRHGVNGKGDASFNGSLIAPVLNVSQARMSQSKCRHGSFSERAEPSVYLFPVPVTGYKKPSSWFSSLFRWRKKKTHPKSVEGLASFSERSNGWDFGRQSWEVPRPSLWEQFGFSSFAGLRSSWEPARPSLEGVMRAADGESVFSGIDFFTDRMVEGREDMRSERENLQDLAGDMANGPDAGRSIDIKRAGSKSRSSGLKKPRLDDWAQTSLSAKPMLMMQKDVSTQTTPPRSSNATEIFIEQRVQHDQQRCEQYAKASHALWSKVWSKTFPNYKWAFNHKHQKDRRQKEVGDMAAVVDEVQDQGSIMSGRSSFYEGMNTESGHHVKIDHFDDIKEHEAWDDAFYSPLQQEREMGNVEKDQYVEKIRGSNISSEDGLLKFYLTPVRGQRMHGLR